MSRKTPPVVVATVDPEARPLLEAVIAGDRPAVFAALTGLDERERRRLAVPVVLWHKAVVRWNGGEVNATPSPHLEGDQLVLRRGRRRDLERFLAQESTLALAVLGTGTLADYRRVSAS